VVVKIWRPLFIYAKHQQLRLLFWNNWKIS